MAAFRAVRQDRPQRPEVISEPRRIRVLPINMSCDSTKVYLPSKPGKQCPYCGRFVLVNDSLFAGAAES